MSVNATATASATGWMSIDISWLARAVGAVLVTCVTVQQQADRTTVSCAGTFCLCWAVSVGQQQEERVMPSYAQRYHDAVAIDGARTRTSKIGTTRRTGCSNHTRKVVVGNGHASLGALCGSYFRRSRRREAASQNHTTDEITPIIGSACTSGFGHAHRGHDA